MIKVYLFPAGSTAVFRNDNQVPSLQQSWLLLYVRMLAASGIDPTKVEFVMPDASRATVFEKADGEYGWSIRE